MGLEDKLGDRESKGLARKALGLGFKAALAAGATAFSLATVGALGPIVGGALGGGVALGGIIKKKPLYDIVNNSLRAYTAVNAVLHPIIWLGDVTLPLIPNETIFGKLARTAYAATGYNAAFVGAFNAAEHLYDNNLNPRGIVKSIKDNFYNKWKRIGLVFLPGYALVANGFASLPILGYNVPTFAANALPAGFYNTVNPVPVAKKQSNPVVGDSNPSKVSHMPRLNYAKQNAA